MAEEKQVSVKIWDEVPGEVAYTGKGPALVGEDFHRDSDWKPIVKTKKGRRVWRNKKWANIWTPET